MFVKRLQIFNFGQHSHLDLDFKGSVVGIVGPNGHGKSTIAQAITYAFLGELPDNAKDVIKHGEKELKVICDFTKNNVDYHIERTAYRGGKSTRSLSYEGIEAPLTTSKKVDDFMEQLLGADKQTITNCIFISQGDIDSIVNESASKRIDLLVKLLNLNYINRRAAAVELTIKQLENTVVPIAPLKQMLDAITKEHQGISNVYSEKLGKFEENYGSKEFIDFIINEFQDYKHLLDSIKLLGDSISEDMESVLYIRNSMGITSRQMTIDDAIKSAEDFVEDQKQELARMEQKFVEDTQQHYKFEECLSTLDNYKIYASSLKEVNDLRSKLFYGFNDETIEQLKVIVKDVCDYFAQYDLNVQGHEFSSKEVEKLSKELEECIKAKTEVDNDLEGVEMEIASLSGIDNSLNSLLNTKLQIKSAYEKNPSADHTCPLCGLKLEAGQKITDSDISDLRSQISTIHNRLQSQSTSKVKLSLKSTELESQRWNVKAKLDFENKKLQSYKDFLDNNLDKESYSSSKLESIKFPPNTTVDIAMLRDTFQSQEYLKFKSLSKSQNSNQAAKDLLSKRFFELTDGVVDLDSIKEEDVSKVDAYEIIPQSILKYSQPISNACIEKQKEKILNLTALLTELRIKVEGVLKKKALIADSEEKVKNHKVFGITQRIQDLQNNEHKCKKLDFSNIEKTVQVCSNEALLEYHEIDALNEELKLKARDKTLKEQEIAELESRNHLVYDQIAELSAILELLNPKEGIIKQYLRYLFSVIQNYVSEYLASMEANFIIDIDDPDYSIYNNENSDEKDKQQDAKNRKQDLSFKFLRTDQANASWLGMHRLSGGQKIKLAIAILLSIQRLVCPELSFLVLDEPSTHLDDGSINALSNLLSNLKDNLNLSNGQVFIIDHNEILNRSFTTTIQL